MEKVTERSEYREGVGCNRMGWGVVDGVSVNANFKLLLITGNITVNGSQKTRRRETHGERNNNNIRTSELTL